MIPIPIQRYSIKAILKDYNLKDVTPLSFDEIKDYISRTLNGEPMPGVVVISGPAQVSVYRHPVMSTITDPELIILESVGEAELDIYKRCWEIRGNPPIPDSGHILIHGKSLVPDEKDAGVEDRCVCISSIPAPIKSPHFSTEVCFEIGGGRDRCYNTLDLEISIQDKTRILYSPQRLKIVQLFSEKLSP